MPRLLPVGLVDPATPIGDPVRNPFGRAWQFHYEVNCCGAPGYPHFTVSGGKPSMLSSLDSLEQWVRSVLATVRQKYDAYSGGFGTDFSAILGERGPGVTTAAERVVIEALSYDARVANVVAEAVLTSAYGMRMSIAVESVAGDVISISDFVLER